MFESLRQAKNKPSSQKKELSFAGVTKLEAKEALVPVCLAFAAFRGKFSIVDAYRKVCRRFYDAVYDSYTYPMVRTYCQLV